MQIFSQTEFTIGCIAVINAALALAAGKALTNFPDTHHCTSQVLMHFHGPRVSELRYDFSAQLTHATEPPIIVAAFK